jgi:hypothetical protein
VNIVILRLGFGVSQILFCLLVGPIKVNSPIIESAKKRGGTSECQFHYFPKKKKAEGVVCSLMEYITLLFVGICLIYLMYEMEVGRIRYIV